MDRWNVERICLQLLKCGTLHSRRMTKRFGIARTRICTFSRINQLYSNFPGRCDLILLIHPHHPFLHNYLAEAEMLLKRRSLMILSMTIFSKNRLDVTVNTVDDETLRERQSFEREFAELTDENSGGDNGDDVDDDEMTTERRGSDDGSSKQPFAEREEDREDEDGQRAAAEFVDAEEDDDDDLTLESIAMVRPPVTHRGAATHMRNSVLACFFAELLLFIQSIPVCDETGVISHKAYSLMNRDVLDRWYLEATLTRSEVDK